MFPRNTRGKPTVPHQIKVINSCAKRLDGSQVSRLQRVCGTFTNSRRKTIRSKGPHISNHGKLIWITFSLGASGREGVSDIGALWCVIVQSIWLQNSDDNMVIPSG